MKLSIIIPAYNEENRIQKTLQPYYDFFNKKLGKDFEIIVVPNNCKDKTLEIVQKFAKTKKNVKIINIPFYVGKGGAVMTGFEAAEGKLVGFTDADNSIIPEEFNKIYENINGYDGIIASRKIRGAIITPKRTMKQDLSSFLFNKLTNLLFNLKFKDTQCGAKLFKSEIIQILIKKNTQKGWMFDVDLLYICKKQGFKIKEFPIIWTDSVGSKLSFKDQITSTLNLIKYRIKTFF
jgi:glycosyltransferase involved in cell wall biosynthesis